MATMENKALQEIELKVGIYGTTLGIIPPEKLQGFIKGKFEEKHPGIVLNVLADWDPYDIGQYETYFSGDESSFDVLEMDTILLGEVVEKKLLHELDEKKYKIKERNLEVAAKAVCYKGKYYGVPTLECASFLVELTANNVDPDEQVFCQLLQQGNITLEEFQRVIEANKSLFDDGALIGNFRGSYSLPCFYLHTYINQHDAGENTMQEGMDALIENETEVLKGMKWFTRLGEKKDGQNPCINSCRPYGEAKPSKVIEDMRTSNHRMMYCYSETISKILADEECKGRGIKPCGVISPPLGVHDKLLMYTGALVINKHHYTSNQAKAEAIDLFLEFFTSLDIRNEIAKCTNICKKEMVNPALSTTAATNTPSYLLMACKDFYTHGFGAEDQLYQQFYTVMSTRAVPAPNTSFVHTRKDMQKKLEEELEFP